MTANPLNREQPDNITDFQSSESVCIPPKVYAQLEALRQSGVVNIYVEVHAGLEHFGFEEAWQWLEANPEMYAEGITRGFEPTDFDVVEEIDSDELADSVPDEPRTHTRMDANTPNEQYLLDYLKSLRRISDQAENYYIDGSWREAAPLTDEELELAEWFDVATDCAPRQCYRNALLTAATFGESYDVVYVEGYVMASSFASPIKHAWVELNGKVVELTFPEGPIPASDAAYLGVDFPVADVRAKILNEGIAEPLVDESI